MDKKKLKSTIEAILFAAGEPVPEARISLVLGVPEEDVADCGRALSGEYERGERGMRVLRLDGKLQMCSAPDYAQDIIKTMERDILSVLSRENVRFSKSQRQIAKYITDNYDKAAFMTAGRLGGVVGVSESTVVRFAAELGYDGYPEMRKAMPFGAFAEVVPGVDGLIHISQIANRRIGKPDEALTVGDEVEAKITAIDNDKQKISLSIRALSEPEPAPKAGDDEHPAHNDKPRDDALVYEVSADGTAIGNAPVGDEKND